MTSRRLRRLCGALLIAVLVLAGCTSQSQSSSTPGTSAAQSSAPGSSSSSAYAGLAIPSFADLLASVEGCVVQINISATTQIGRRTVQQQGAGSGWIITSDGMIVTNDHVVEGATTITVVTGGGQTYSAQVVNTDPAHDLAVVKVNATGLKPIKTGDASKLRTGDWVLAIGNPLGEGITATEGIVSRMGVDVPLSATQTYSNLIETTAPINPGNSGGPLINMAGEVVGITTLGATGVQGMGYAINMVDALPIIQRLMGK